MSATDTKESHDTSHAHPTPRKYVTIAVVLAVLTALEVSTYFFDFGRVAIPLLIVLMVIKFLYVAGWFMHLKFDAKLFSTLMYAGLAFALVLYMLAVLLVMAGHMPGA